MAVCYQLSAVSYQLSAVSLKKKKPPPPAGEEEACANDHMSRGDLPPQPSVQSALECSRLTVRELLQDFHPAEEDDPNDLQAA